MSKTNLLYLHGFNSSPQSLKSRQTQQYFAQKDPKINFICPQILCSPNAAIAQLTEIIEPIIYNNNTANKCLLIGSSLGGYFATYFAEKYSLPAVLINPAVKPYQLLTDYLGDQTNPYTQETYQVNKSFIVDLKVIEQHQLDDKNNYLVMVQTGDEVLDYQQAVDKYKNKRLLIQQGGDHSFIDYDKMLPQIAEFFKLV
ncbi:MAG: esterase YqiA [Alteromonadaceae bacterium]|nr:esterase YqiA [Alteromonadaceae bacterium]